ncbi:MAG: Zn-ribbon domain-containing OB-fold protein [Mycobacteriales bacterium]
MAPATTDPATDVLLAPHVLDYSYTRSTGPVLGAFLTGLRERRVLGSRCPDGRVLVPPQEYDPRTAEATDPALVPVAAEGTVTSWSWNPRPRPGQPLDRAFAWVLVRLDGADTALLHGCDSGSPDLVRTGMRVRVRWAEEPTGSIHDIACFVPCRDADLENR